MYKLLVSCIILFFISSCNRNSDNVQITYDTIDADTSLMSFNEVLGTNYIGSLPCPDCIGIDTKLTIIDDSTFSISETYKHINSKDSLNSTVGKLAIVSGLDGQENSVYELIMGNEKANKYFKIIGDSALQLLDKEKNVVLSTGNVYLKKQ